MRFLLTIMAMAMLAVSIGCESPTPSADAASDTQMVSVKLPGMT